MKIRYGIRTKYGIFLCEEENNKIVSLRLPKQIRALAEDSTSRLGRLLNRYLNGHRVRFDLALDLRGTAFQKKVWRYLGKIPYGVTRSYKDIARKLYLNKAYQAVGQACKKNPLPIIIPCHRIIGSGGSLGGYRPGIAWKKFLLGLEKGRNKQ